MTEAVVVVVIRGVVLESELCVVDVLLDGVVVPVVTVECPADSTTSSIAMSCLVVDELTC